MSTTPAEPLPASTHARLKEYAAATRANAERLRRVGDKRAALIFYLHAADLEDILAGRPFGKREKPEQI